MLAGALLDAEVKIGELTNEIPTQQGARTDIKPIRTTANKLDEISKLGFNKDQVSRFQQKEGGLIGII